MKTPQLTKYIFLLLILLVAGTLNAASKVSGKEEASEQGLLDNGLGTDSELEAQSNRLPLLLRDLKIMMADAVIADAMRDTVEVAYYFDRMFDLLEEAEQLGEMTEEDQEEFSRFESALIEIFSSQLQTVDKSMVQVDADQVTAAISEYLEPVEIELGDSKFTVIDDRDGHIPIVSNSQVEKVINFLQTSRKAEFAIWLERYGLYHDMILEILNAYSLPEEIIVMSMIESGLNPKAYSRANAVGMWQFVYSTGKIYGLERNWWIDERRDPIKSTHAACRHLQDLYTRFEDWYLVISAYNAGPNRIQRAIDLHGTHNYWQLYSLPRETRNHIPTFLAAAIIVRDPEKYGFQKPVIQPWDFDEVELDKSADLNVLARAAGVKVEELRRLNPELRQAATPTDMTYTLRIPEGTGAKFQAAYASIPESERYAPEYVYHKVRYGETLWDISKRYQVSIHTIASVNKIRNRHKIQIGQKLMIPVKGAASQSSIATYTAPTGPPGTVKVVYTVRKGDTLGQIAEDYNTRASRIRRWNGLKYGEYIYPGQRLTLWIPQG